MKKIIPLKKELNFNSNLAEVTSISLEHNLNLENEHVLGELIITGTYKINDTSINVENFDFKIPVDIEISNRYDISNLKIDIDDFFYEVLDNSTLNVSVTIALDNLEEKVIKEEKVENTVDVPIETVTENIIEDVKPFPIKEAEERISQEEVGSIFTNFDESKETYVTYKVCIVKEGDNIDSILLKYNITRETLEQYNNLSEIKIGDKLIIPAVYAKN